MRDTVAQGWEKPGRGPTFQIAEVERTVLPTRVRSNAKPR